MTYLKAYKIESYFYQLEVQFKSQRSKWQLLTRNYPTWNKITIQLFLHSLLAGELFCP